MLPIIAGLWANPLARKIAVYVGIGVVVLFLFRIWLVRHDDKIYLQGKVAASAEIEKAKKAEWDAKEKAIADRDQQVTEKLRQLDADRQVITAKTEELARLNQQSRSTLARIEGQSRALREARDEDINRIPSSQLLDTLRRRSAELGTTSTN